MKFHARLWGVPALMLLVYCLSGCMTVPQPEYVWTDTTSQGRNDDALQEDIAECNEEGTEAYRRAQADNPPKPTRGPSYGVMGAQTLLFLGMYRNAENQAYNSCMNGRGWRWEQQPASTQPYVQTQTAPHPDPVIAKINSCSSRCTDLKVTEHAKCFDQCMGYSH